ncbi:MAG: hypothetical protein MK086_00055 [Flavobacteriales bacterium]|nr:hypothetical protein [Flavobacteriales bacterium]
MSENDKNEKEYLRGLASNLFNEKKDSEREIPEGYFENLESEVLKKIQVDQDESTPVRRLVNYRNLAIAAGFAILLAAIPFLKDSFESSPDEMAESPAEAIRTTSISESDVALYLADEYDLEAIAMDYDLEFESETASDLTEDEILDYLIDSEISESLIYESL